MAYRKQIQKQQSILEERSCRVRRRFVYVAPSVEHRPPPEGPDQGPDWPPVLEAGVRRRELLHQLHVHEPASLTERQNFHAICNLGPFGRSETIEQQRVTAFVEIAENLHSAPTPDGRQERVQFARRRPEAVAGQFRSPRQEPERTHAFSGDRRLIGSD